MSVDTLQSVFTPLPLLLLVTLLTFAVFGCAVRARSHSIAPTCSARSPNTIYNPNAKPGKKNKGCQGSGRCLNLKNEVQRTPVAKSEEEVDDDDVDEDHPQYRGGATFGWMFWIMGLSYQQLLEGVPGTGTRKDGMAGSMLKINLDGIVLLRFHAICLRVAILATVLGMCVVMPICMTAKCGMDDETSVYSCDPKFAGFNITDFEMTTIKNLLDQDIFSKNMTELIKVYNYTEETKWYESFVGSDSRVWRSSVHAYLGRLYGIVVVSWILVCYTLHRLKKEWAGALALRRIYYLEKEHWQRREKELNETLYNDHMEETSDDNKLDCPERPIWIPHPEQNNNVPNIELYSVLVENIPTLPNELSYEGGAGEDSIMDWQMKVTTGFFDQCVANQPGFSSSVAAITLLPEASKLALGWKRWKRHGAMLRRLRYIRQLINQRKQSISKCLNQRKDNHDDEQNLVGNGDLSFENDNTNSMKMQSTFDSSNWNLSHEKQYRLMNIFGKEFDDIHHRKIEKEILLPQITKYGPEQTAVLSKEYSTASMCCPNGCNDQKLVEMSLQELEDLEEEAEDEVERSFQNLIEVQKSCMMHSDSRLQTDYEKQPNDIEIQLNTEHLTLTNQGRVKLHSIIENSNEQNSHCSENYLKTEEDVPDWQKVEQAMDDKSYHLFSGAWKCSNINLFKDCVLRITNRFQNPVKNTLDTMSEIKSTSTFAIVTFTNRQAAVAARKCTSDGRGYGRWKSVSDLPIAPLADASVGDITDCRGCCKPVTLTINRKQKWMRQFITICSLFLIYTLWAFPLDIFGSSEVKFYERLAEFLGDSFPFMPPKDDLNDLLSTQIPATYTTLFMAVAAPIFKGLATSSANALSVSQSEFVALKYFWWFMVFSAFFGQSATSVFLQYVRKLGDDDEYTIAMLVNYLILAIPSMSVVWLKWLMIKCFISVPIMYMLNLWAVITYPLKCLQRPILGGGSGTPVPYRLSIDCGFIFFIMFGLTPTYPLVTPFVLYYFLFCSPLWRRNLLYLYRPSHDAGGIRWPFFADVLVSGMIVAQCFFTLQLMLFGVFGPALLAALSIVPIILHRKRIRDDYYDAYMDAALLQTSQVDGWESTVTTSKVKREKFRRFLVDAHKAAYVPICLAAGNNSDSLTFEPAVVTPLESDIEPSKSMNDNDPVSGPNFRNSMQRGAYWRRVSVRRNIAESKDF